MLCRSVDVRRAAELETSPRVVPYVRGTPHPIRACCAWQYPFRVLEGPAAPYSARVTLNPSSPSQLPFLPGTHRPPGFSLPFLLTDAFPLSSSHSCFPLMYLINVAMLPRAGHGTWSRGHTGDGRGKNPPLPRLGVLAERGRWAQNSVRRWKRCTDMATGDLIQVGWP